MCANNTHYDEVRNKVAYSNDGKPDHLRENHRLERALLKLSSTGAHIPCQGRTPESRTLELS